jgi:ParB family chromosome partitioning protein
MSPTPRRPLQIDDPTGRAPQACHVAHPPAPGSSRLRDLPIHLITPNSDQPRKHFDETALDALAGSISERGVLQPIIVRPLPHDTYQLIAGERRWRAAQRAGLTTIPALIDTAITGETDPLELALIENIARENLTPVEEARTIALLLDDLNVTTTALAKRLGRSRTDLAHTVRLLDLPDETLDLIDCGQLSKGHGKALLTEPDHHRRRILTRRAIEHGWSVRQLEGEIARCRKPQSRVPEPHPDQRAAAARLQDLISTATGTDARARPHREGYQVILDQTAADHLTRLLDRPSHAPAL